MKPRKPVPAVKAEAATPKAITQNWSSGLPPGIFLFAAIAVFYVWTATSSQYPLVWGTKKLDHYNLLAEGFLRGHLYLAQDPPKEMLALKDPYDPAANKPYRLHDASLYKGHYYVYFGPIPAITLYLPWRVITGWSIPNNLAVILYLLVGYIFSCLLLFKLMDACNVRPSWLEKRLAIAALGLCQTVPIILRRPYMYETAVASGFCFLLAGLYFLARYVVSRNARPYSAVLAGLFLGFTAGCRPDYVVVVIVVTAGYLVYLLRSRSLRGRELIRELYLFGAPIAICAVLLAWYNFARFGNPLEVGQDYQLIGNTTDRGIPPDPAGIDGLHKLLIQPPKWVRRFPFVELATAGRFGAEQWPDHGGRVEPIAGLLVISPICLLGIGLPFLVWRFRSSMPAQGRFVLLVVYAGAMITLITIPKVVFAVTQRYEVDFAPSILVVSLFAALWLVTRIERTSLRIASTVVLALVIAGSAFVQACLSINGYENELLERDFVTYTSLASAFGDNALNMRRPVYGMILTGTIVFPQPSFQRREALITTGITGRSNCIFVEYLDGGRIKLNTYMSGRGIQYGVPFAVTPGKSYGIAISYIGGERHLTAQVDENTVLDVDTFIYPTSFEDATVLRNGIGIPPDVQPFSGELNAPSGLQFASAGVK